MAILPKTIRVQIMMAFVICFVFMGAIIAVNYSNFKRLSWSMEFFELAQDLGSTTLEMRRYEKNFFLYRQNFNYEENLTYSNRLALTLQREEESLTEAMGAQNYANFVKYIKEYAELMDKLHRTDCDGSSGCHELETSIRGVGQHLVILSDQLITTERKEVNRLLRQMVPLPLVSLVLLLGLLLFVIFFIGEKVVRPLARIRRESNAVARGDFKRITTYGGPENEINHLIQAINRMMTELENRQEQLIQSRKIASIGRLTAGVAHEINNPVNNLSLILESLIDGGEEMKQDERTRLYQEAMDQAERTSDIVKNLLEFSRANHPRLEEVDLTLLVDKTARLVKNELDLNNIHFAREGLSTLPKILVDKGGMQQVVLNLFMNGIQAMDKGGQLRAVIGLSDDSAEARIDVIDTGPGIPPEDLGQIFDPFFTTKQQRGGTGLGLSVSYNIVKKNGGRIEVESKLGEGTCFSVFLPFSRGPGSGE